VSNTTDAAALAAELQQTLTRHGFVRCDIAACNCGGWHIRYGLRQRFDEFTQALSDAGHPLTNDNGNLALNALGDLVAERDALRAQVAALEARQVPDGWRLVPVEPTLDMTRTARVNMEYGACTPAQIWAAMLHAAPTAPAPKEKP